MPIYPDNSHNHPDQGMTVADMLATQRVAERRNEIIMFRDTGAWSRPYIELGHPTKPFHVKGKSSDWGPHAGLVPYNSEFSKAFADKDITKGKQANRDAIKGNFARPVPVFVDEAFLRRERLVPRGSAGRSPIDRMTSPRPGILYFFCTKPHDDSTKPGKPYVLFGKKASDGRYEIFTFPLDAAGASEKTLFLKESAAEPLLAMTVPGADKPITGDYDLFAVCPSWANYGSLDRKMNPALDDPRIDSSNKRTIQKAATGDLKAIASLAALNSAETAEDPDRGNLTGRLAALIPALVSEMGGRFPRVHHNAESGRPFAPGASDGFPLTTFHPRRGIGGYTFLNATINDVNDLRDYFNRLYAGGYYPPRNRSWSMPALNPLLRGYRA
ncbi:MAG: anthrax toxin-like adenylyl cyclase domain-containing protein [Planctomycetota bacterium]|nr:anthrax toxin-like adenylyl cyclase domain-containing protein [Planctomycetota bacterium]